jgi:hypothetical protein
MPPRPQDPTPELREQDRLAARRVRAEDRIISVITRELLVDSQELSRRIQRRIMRLDLDSRGRIKQTDKNLRELQKINDLTDQGALLITNRAIRKLQNETDALQRFYEDEIRSIQPGITQAGIVRIVDSNQTRAVLNTNLNPMRDVAAGLTAEMRRQLNASLFEDIGPEEMAQRVRRLLEGTKDKRGNPMTRHADTLAKTAYNAYASALTHQNINFDEVVAYYYSGPEDARNRDFCARHVEKIHDKETLEARIAEQPNATLQNPGGYNCRHKLFPISMFDPEGEPFLSDEQRRIVEAADNAN